MVQQHQEHVFFGIQHEKTRPQRWFHAEVERLAHRFGELHFEPVDVVHAQRRALLDHLLVRGSVDRREHRAQALVPVHDIADRCLQRVAVQRSRKPQRHRDVVGGARAFELLEEPQPLLGERQRDALVARRRSHRGPGFGGAVQPGGQARHRRRLEHRAHRQFHVESRPDPADQPGREQRMPAQFEEAVVGVHARDAEHFREQSAENFLA